MEYRNDLSVVISGEAGQGIQLIEEMTAAASKLRGYHVFSYSEFMSRIRGGNNSTELRISSHRVQAFVKRIDLFFPLNEKAFDRFRDRINDQTIVIGDEQHLRSCIEEKGCSAVPVPRGRLDEALGSNRYYNTAIFGFICCLISVDRQQAETILKSHIKRDDPSIIEKNLEALCAGYSWYGEISAVKNITISIKASEEAKNAPRLYGSDAIGIGALAGGCDFVSSYPMSPSTEVLTFMASQSGNFEIVVEQAEDEICAVNMAVGAWYAGGRAMVTTSGGGFALMTEGVSLAGMSETPLVVHVGQRPGPATGLPTRTEQADLNMVLNAGHGEFPRVIFAPGTLEDGIELTRRAFDLADKYQVPAFILTDQFFLDSSAMATEIDRDIVSPEKNIKATDAAYKRYAVTDSGISPRGVPGFGEGIVCSASDEHDEGGYITEDPSVRIAMVEKRMGKIRHLIREAEPPRFFGPKDYHGIIVCWGSVYTALHEAFDLLALPGVAMLHFRQVYPVHPETEKYLLKADKRIMVENNATSQFGRLLTLHTGLAFHETILKYDGMPFSVEEIADALKGLFNHKKRGGENEYLRS